MYACERQKLRSPISKLDQTTSQHLEGKGLSLYTDTRGERGDKEDKRTVAFIVGIASVVRQEFHTIVFSKVLGMRLCEF